ncbi:hypothetical protein EXIGLDRAFT_847827 [Exidia glandulosa HHB12029]|uniref:Uncharacterized protein n=1 Tax=Exidia glandulosa HHB12029 TaxID=1314781 RepID=A0A166MIK9_EXIGL|nr:hypothetical protein EXIGLDRAFT_847827 [Exidia glandulosa HHB12029]
MDSPTSPMRLSYGAKSAMVPFLASFEACCTTAHDVFGITPEVELALFRVTGKGESSTYSPLAADGWTDFTMSTHSGVPLIAVRLAHDIKMLEAHPRSPMWQLPQKRPFDDEDETLSVAFFMSWNIRDHDLDARTDDEVCSVLESIAEQYPEIASRKEDLFVEHRRRRVLPGETFADVGAYDADGEFVVYAYVHFP